MPGPGRSSPGSRPIGPHESEPSVVNRTAPSRSVRTRRAPATAPRRWMGVAEPVAGSDTEHHPPRLEGGHEVRSGGCPASMVRCLHDIDRAHLRANGALRSALDVAGEQDSTFPIPTSRTRLIVHPGAPMPHEIRTWVEPSHAPSRVRAASRWPRWPTPGARSPGPPPPARVVGTRRPAARKSGRVRAAGPPCDPGADETAPRHRAHARRTAGAIQARRRGGPPSTSRRPSGCSSNVASPCPTGRKVTARRPAGRAGGQGHEDQQDRHRWPASEEQGPNENPRPKWADGWGPGRARPVREDRVRLHTHHRPGPRPASRADPEPPARRVQMPQRQQAEEAPRDSTEGTPERWTGRSMRHPEGSHARAHRGSHRTRTPPEDPRGVRRKPAQQPGCHEQQTRHGTKGKTKSQVTGKPRLHQHHPARDETEDGRRSRRLPRSHATAPSENMSRARRALVGAPAWAAKAAAASTPAHTGSTRAGHTHGSMESGASNHLAHHERNPVTRPMWSPLTARRCRVPVRVSSATSPFSQPRSSRQGTQEVAMPCKPVGLERRDAAAPSGTTVERPLSPVGHEPLRSLIRFSR